MVGGEYLISEAQVDQPLARELTLEFKTWREYSLFSTTNETGNLIIFHGDDKNWNELKNTCKKGGVLLRISRGGNLEELKEFNGAHDDVPFFHLVNLPSHLEAWREIIEFLRKARNKNGKIEINDFDEKLLFYFVPSRLKEICNICLFEKESNSAVPIANCSAAICRKAYAATAFSCESAVLRALNKLSCEIEAILASKRDCSKGVAVCVCANGDCLMSQFNIIAKDDLNPLLARNLSSVLASVLLSFPEISWIGPEATSLSQLNVFSKISGDDLFDSTGCRNAVRRRLQEGTSVGERVVALIIPLRVHTAAAFDDEEDFAYFNAYVAYRFGYRAFPVVTNTQAEQLCIGKESSGVDLTFEDICISWPDASSEIHYSDLSGLRDVGKKPQEWRSRKRLRLEAARHRIFVTTQHRQTANENLDRENGCYIKSGECVAFKIGGYGKIVAKPLSGMFDLWRRAGGFKKKGGPGIGKWGYADGFDWPPKKENLAEVGGESPGHSAPGRLLMIANTLIERCERLLPKVKSVKDAVLCAVLATDALELLGNRTPTTAMEALRLKHIAEVTAECQFSGIEYRIEVNDRLKELQRDARVIGHWFGPKRRKMAAMNAEMKTLVQVRSVFRNHGQFDEAQVCGNRIRELHFHLWMRQQPWRNVFRPVLWYFNLALKSFPIFTFLIFFWMAVFTCLYHLCDAPSSAPQGWWKAIHYALTRFLDFKEFPANTSVGCHIVTIFASIMKITHAGLFFSLLLNNIQRKD